MPIGGEPSQCRQLESAVSIFTDNSTNSVNTQIKIRSNRRILGVVQQLLPEPARERELQAQVLSLIAI